MTADMPADRAVLIRDRVAALRARDAEITTAAVRGAQPSDGGLAQHQVREAAAWLEDCLPSARAGVRDARRTADHGRFLIDQARARNDEETRRLLTAEVIELEQILDDPHRLARWERPRLGA